MIYLHWWDNWNAFVEDLLDLVVSKFFWCLPCLWTVSVMSESEPNPKPSIPFNLFKTIAGPNGDGVIPNGWIEHSRTTLNAIITFRWIKNAVLSCRWKSRFGLIKVTS